MTAPAVPTEKSFLKLLFMPNHWAPYFMAAQTPYQAFCTWQTLMATMSVQADRDDVSIPILNWFRAVCVRAGNGNMQRTRSSLAIEWGSVLPGRSLLHWATKHLAPFCLPMPIQPPYPHRLPPLPPGPPVAQAALPVRIIDTASFLQPMDQRPTIYDLMMEEGRTLPRIEAMDPPGSLRPPPQCRISSPHRCLRQPHARHQRFAVRVQQ